jgi:hypothetical protein
MGLASLAIASVAALGPTSPGEQFTRPMGVPLASATLTDVQAKLGPADSWEQGSGGEWYTAICYIAIGARTRITFMSGVLGRSQHVVTGVSLAANTASGGHRCAQLPLSLDQRVAAGLGGLRLGMRTEEFRRVVGHVETIQEGRLAAGFEHSDPLTAADLAHLPKGASDHLAADTAIFVAGRFAHGRLIELTVEKTVTY